MQEHLSRLTNEIKELQEENKKLVVSQVAAMCQYDIGRAQECVVCVLLLLLSEKKKKKSPSPLPSESLNDPPQLFVTWPFPKESRNATDHAYSR